MERLDGAGDEADPVPERVPQRPRSPPVYADPLAVLHINPNPTTRAASTALKALALEATLLEGAGRIPNVLSALVVVLDRAQQERCPELVVQASAVVKRIHEQRAAADPDGRLTTILEEASELMDECASPCPWPTRR